jgi:hypothetical protein
MPETPVDRAICEEGEWEREKLRRAFPKVHIDGARPQD